MFLSGIGIGFCYGPSVIIVGMYFEKRRALATGITFSASSGGSFCFPPLIEYCLDSYGLSGALLIMGGVMFHMCAIGMLFRSPDFYQLQSDVSLSKTLPTVDELLESKDAVLSVASDDADNVESNPLTSEPTTTTNANVHSSSISCGRVNIRNKTNLDQSELQKETSQWDILKNPVLYIYALTFPLTGSSFTSCTIIVYLHALDIGISKYNAAFLVATLGIANGVSRLVTGIFSDYKLVQTKHTYQAATLGNVVVLCLFPLVRHYAYLATMSVLCGFFAGAAIVLAPVLIADEVSTDNLPVAFAVLFRLVFITLEKRTNTTAVKCNLEYYIQTYIPSKTQIS